jgi:two-component system, NarL family, sensor kinase
MNAPQSTRWARVTLAATTTFALAALAVSLIKSNAGGSGPFALIGVALGLLGLLIVSRAGNAVGWFFLVAGLSIAVSSFTDGYIHYSLRGRPEPLPGTSLAGWLNNLAFGLLAAPLPLIFLVFPTGRIPSPKWRPVVWLWGAGMAALAIGLAFRPGQVFATPPEQGAIDVVNPIGIAGLDPFLG